jgi:hypothetical protein
MDRIIVITAVLVAGHVLSYLILKKKIDRALQPSQLLDKIRQEVNGIIVELNGTTDRNIALVEDRLNTLKEHLSQADRKLSVLQRDAEKREISQKVYARLGQASRGEAARDEAARTAGEDSKSSKQEEIVRLHEAGFSTPIIAKRVGAPLGEVELIISLAESRS